MSVVRLALFELRRMTRGRLPRAALAVLTVIPLLYGALYLYAFWDPYGNLDRIPVALVNADRPAKAGDGTEVHAGQDLTDELHRPQGLRLDRHRLRRRHRRFAQRPLPPGLLHPGGLLRHPGGQAPSPDQPARRGELKVVNDDATNYLSGLLARTAFSEIRAAAAESTAAAYFDRMLIGFTDAKAETGRAADGAGRIADGLGASEAGAGKIAGGLDSAEDGAGQLAGGLDEVGPGRRQAGRRARPAAPPARRSSPTAPTARPPRPAPPPARSTPPPTGTSRCCARTPRTSERAATASPTARRLLADGIDALPAKADAVVDPGGAGPRPARRAGRGPPRARRRPEPRGRPAGRRQGRRAAARAMVSALDRTDLAALRRR